MIPLGTLDQLAAACLRAHLHQTQGGVTGSHAKLLRSVGWAMYALRKYFNDLCVTLGASMIDNAERISLVSTTDNTVTKANVSVSLGLIVTELVINALKHAFPGRNQTGTRA